jgi:hypothetical protein
MLIQKNGWDIVELLVVFFVFLDLWNQYWYILKTPNN